MPWFRAFLLAFPLTGCLGLVAQPAFAQHGGGRGGGGAEQGSGGASAPSNSTSRGFLPGGIYDRDRSGGNRNRPPDSAGTVAGIRSKTQLGPLGRWWDDKHFAGDLKLRPDQKQRMDSVFETSRPMLLKSLQDYQQEQGKLEAMYRSKTLDESTLYAQIDRVSQTRAELGKAYTHYMLQIRAEMEPDQLALLDAASGKQQ